MIQVQAEEITLESLSNGPGILPFKLGDTRVISHYHFFVQPIDLNDVRSSVETVRKQVQDLTPELNNKTSFMFEPHIQYLIAKLNDVSDQLETFEVKRVKRGLINGLGSVIKSISGNLDYTDAIKYDNAIRILEQNQNNLNAEINHQMSLSKQWASRSANILDRIIENQKKMEGVINSILASNLEHEASLVKFAHLAQLLLILGDNVDSLSSEITRLQNLLAFIKAKSTHHSTISFKLISIWLID